MFALYATKWTEYERGWGQRPDGITLFEDRSTGEKHIEEHYAKRGNGPAPDEYSNPSKLELVEVSENLYNEVMSKGSLWLSTNNINQLTLWT